jgi:hypothetical protein
MPSKYRKFRAGDEFTSEVLNTIFAELDRLRGMSGSGMVSVDYADGSVPPVIVGHAAPGGDLRIWLPTGIAAGTVGSPALKTDTILMVRSGDGWTTTGGTTIAKLFNCDTVAITGAKAGWAVRRDDNSYELKIADC